MVIHMILCCSRKEQVIESKADHMVSVGLLYQNKAKLILGKSRKSPSQLLHFRRPTIYRRKELVELYPFLLLSSPELI